MRHSEEEILTEFSSQVVASHGLIVTRILTGERVEPGLFLHLAAELLAIAKITRLCIRSVDYVKEAKACWQEAAKVFEQSAELWARLPHDEELVETHRRVLQQLCAMAADELDLYTISAEQRRAERY